ncbi:UNVERIFIED_CONTAM: hypothetical protein HDU68_003202, partial [Siphonaria sp. JEL0065]
MESEGGEQEADFTLLQNHVDASLRVSEALELPEAEAIYYSLLAVSSKFGFAVFATKKGFAFAFTKDIRGELEKVGPRQCVNVAAKRDYTVDDDDVVNQIRLSANNELVFIGLNSGKILLYKAASLASGNKKPHKTFKCPNEEDFVILPNPEVFPDICAVTCADGTLHILNASTGVFTHLNDFFGIVAMSWSRKGKQLAIGDQTGIVRQISIEGVVKNTIAVAPSLADDVVSVQHIVWLEDKTFLVIYSKESFDTATLYVITQTGTVKKGLQTTYTKLSDPCPTHSDDRQSGNYYSALVTGLGDTTFLIAYANFASMDLGFLGKKENEWKNWQVGESGITLPLDNEDKDTYPVGLDIDFTRSEPVKALSPSEADLPPCPLLYVLNNDGCLLVYNIVDPLTAKRASACDAMTAAEPLIGRSR